MRPASFSPTLRKRMRSHANPRAWPHPLRARTIERGEVGGVLLVANLFQFQLGAAPVEHAFEWEVEGCHRLALPAAGKLLIRVASSSMRESVSGSGHFA